MRFILLPIVAVMTYSSASALNTLSDMSPPSTAEIWPCAGSIPVFNPEGCPSPSINLDQRDSSALELGPPAPRDCADRIERVRQDLAQPKLDRSPASADKPLLIAAVHKQIDGCAVLQMKGDVNDLRPIPKPAEGPLLQPAR